MHNFRRVHQGVQIASKCVLAPQWQKEKEDHYKFITGAPQYSLSILFLTQPIWIKFCALYPRAARRSAFSASHTSAIITDSKRASPLL
jgi:hypothetical protein